MRPDFGDGHAKAAGPKLSVGERDLRSGSPWCQGFAQAFQPKRPMRAVDLGDAMKAGMRDLA
jgi:hypothetical protein